MSDKKGTKEAKEAKEAKKGERRGGGRGTHGSITKAGKVRMQTIQIPKTNTKKHSGPSVGNRKRVAKMQDRLRKEAEKRNEQTHR
jgi:ribosomal protein S30